MTRIIPPEELFNPPEPVLVRQSPNGIAGGSCGQHRCRACHCNVGYSGHLLAARHTHDMDE